MWRGCALRRLAGAAVASVVTPTWRPAVRAPAPADQEVPQAGASAIAAKRSVLRAGGRDDRRSRCRVAGGDLGGCAGRFRPASAAARAVARGARRGASAATRTEPATPAITAYGAIR